MAHHHHCHLSYAFWLGSYPHPSGATGHCRRVVAGVMADWAIFSNAYLMIQHFLSEDRYSPTESAAAAVGRKWSTDGSYPVAQKTSLCVGEATAQMGPVSFFQTLPRQTSFGPEPRGKLSW